MNVALWIAQGLLAIMMFLLGIIKLTNNNADLIKKGNGRMDWAEGISAPFMKVIELAEVIIALGLILPLALNILPALTPAAALGAILTMLSALSLHIKRKEEPKSLIINFVFILLAEFALYGRLGRLALLTVI